MKELLKKERLTAAESKLLSEFVRSPRTKRARRERYKIYLSSKCWRGFRKKIMERANGLCEKCFLVPPVHVHHLTYERIGRERKSDLMALCKECHYSFHKKWNWRQFKVDGPIAKALLTEKNK
jgi:5-methylcytosine-specific restriction endonuclease McrA